MRFKFKPQTCMLVAGLVTSAYATCYYQQTSATCFPSGAQVDAIYFPSQNGSYTAVYATSAWNVGANNVVTTSNGSQGYATYTPASPPGYCQGPAKFTEPVSGHQTTTYWQNSAADRFGTYPVPNNPPGGFWGTTTGTTCS
jgi:hypothetical protein